VFECDLNCSDDNQNWLSDGEFLCKYRMHRGTLDAITNLIKGDPIFERGQQGPPQLPVKHQLETNQAPHRREVSPPELCWHDGRDIA
jgi:hypothetical protein